MLQTSDNVIADVLARQVALAQHQPASFTGAVAAIRTVLARLGAHVGAGMNDGSGLSSGDRVSPAALAAVLRLIAGYGPPAAAQLRLIASSCPSPAGAARSQDRYTAGAERLRPGACGPRPARCRPVSSLAGLVRDKSGRLLLFAFDADRAPGTFGAEAALDQTVAARAAPVRLRLTSAPGRRR